LLNDETIISLRPDRHVLRLALQHPPRYNLKPTLPYLPKLGLSKFATHFGAGFFEEIHTEGLKLARKADDIDVTHWRVLDRLLEQRRQYGGGGGRDEDVRRALVDRRHGQIGKLISRMKICNRLPKRRLARLVACSAETP
jgi:hypothetical protein